MSKGTDLVSSLSDLGVDIHRVSGDEINGRCPVHRRYKGRESTRNSWYLNVDTGLWHCFTCGARGNLSMLLAELAADPSELWHIQRDMIANGLDRFSRRDEEEEWEPTPEIDWISYRQFKDLPERMRDVRQLSQEACKRFGIRWDTERKALIQPFISPVGELMGWQAKKAGGWFENTPTGIHKSSTLFGIERAFHPTGLLLESPLDVVRWHSVMDDKPVSAVASFGASVSDEQIELLDELFDTIILAMDNDDAGLNETKRLSNKGKVPTRMSNGKLRYWNYAGTDAKDIGDMTDDEIRDGYERITRLPPFTSRRRKA